MFGLNTKKTYYEIWVRASKKDVGYTPTKTLKQYKTQEAALTDLEIALDVFINTYTVPEQSELRFDAAVMKVEYINKFFVSDIHSFELVKEISR